MAAKKILVSYDFAKNEIQNAVVQVLSSAPSSPVPGQVYYDSTAQRLIFRGTSAWIDASARANHSGTQVASTISDFDTQVRTNRLDQLAAPTGALSVNSQRITNLANGISAQDAVTYSQWQSYLNGTDWKDSVRVATTANITLSGLQTIDGISVGSGERVLVKNQSTASENGLWVASSGGWTRAADGADGFLQPSSCVFVNEGTTLADTQWRITTDGAITVGTTSITWVQFGAGSSYTAGTGISIGGNVISVDLAVVPRKYSVNVGDGTSTSYTVTHNLNTRDIVVSIRDATSHAMVEADVVAATVNTATIIFAVAPTSNAYRVTVVG